MTNLWHALYPVAFIAAWVAGTVGVVIVAGLIVFGLIVAAGLLVEWVFDRL